ncbi:Dicer-like protein [Thalictrum thalictroides]|uniref:Dicer-like protein n=1 Tax=Thalictrum thalictroides TaxID=46969 RepID=A0A7J6VUN2_THATH|nr:Dicer-like protein [Thalictrum thalictroides]
MTLPPSAPVQRIVSPKVINMHLAKQLLCLETCRKLHESGALDDHLLPIVEEPLADGGLKTNKGYFSGAGTTKRKELHGTTSVHALSGSWGAQTDGISLYAYRIDFSCSQVGVIYSGFVLLIESKLDNEVANAELKLFLVADKLVKSSVSPCGQLYLNTEQVKNAKKFQELFFNGLFGKLFTGSKSSGIQREFLLKHDNKSLWSSSNMYLLLPLQLPMPLDESIKIDWKGINSSASAVEFVKEHAIISEKHCYPKKHVEAEYKGGDIIKFANTSVPIHALKEMIVLAIHTGKIYSVLDVRIEMSAESSFDGDDEVSSGYNSFGDYFEKK